MLGNALNLEIHPVMDGFGRCTSGNSYYEVLLVFLVVEARKAKDPGCIGGRWIAAETPCQTAQKFFGLVLCDTFDTPDDLVFVRRSLKDVIRFRHGGIFVDRSESSLSFLVEV